MTVGSLFAGIGGFDLGFERAGFEIKWQVEIDNYASRVLAKHWPHVRRYGDIRCIDWNTVEPVDLVCGGFPCQPHSVAGAQLGAADDRDLWPEYRRAIRGLRPRGLRWVVAENVSGILATDAGRFFGGVLRDLAESGYGVEWDCIPASAVGAPHQRDRVWIVAYTDQGRELQPERSQRHERRWTRDSGQAMALSGGDGLERSVSPGDGQSEGGRILARSQAARASLEGRTEQWSTEPNVGRVAYGIPARVDRLKGLGNAIVPQIAEWIGHQIQAAESLGAA